MSSSRRSRMKGSSSTSPRFSCRWSGSSRIVHFEELWLLRDLYGQAPVANSHREVYDAFRLERNGRSKPPVLRPEAVRAYATDIRERVLEAVEHTDLDRPGPLLRKGFVFGLVLQHELQHQETMLQTLQLRTKVEYPVRDDSPFGDTSDGPGEIRVNSGSFVLGVSPAHGRGLGVDVVPLPSLSRLFGVPVSRVLRGLLRGRVPRPPRRLLGDGLGRRALQLPELGSPRPPSALRGISLRARCVSLGASVRVEVPGQRELSPKSPPRATLASLRGHPDADPGDLAVRRSSLLFDAMTRLRTATSRLRSPRAIAVMSPSPRMRPRSPSGREKLRDGAPVEGIDAP